MPVMVLDMNDRRPAWAMPPWLAHEIRGALPADWELRVMETPADGSGDGMVNLDPALMKAARDAEVYLGYGVPAALLRAAHGLKWGDLRVRGNRTGDGEALPGAGSPGPGL